MEKSPLIVLTGPTSVGKTKLSVKLAKEMGGEIISADSMQVYKGMDIGSAKVTIEEMDNVPHHLIDVLDPKEDFNVFIFKEMCDKIIPGILERGHIPILVGGTGFYIQAVLRGIEFDENENDDSYRTYLENLAEEKGAQYLNEMLREVDPESADAIHQNNVKRTIRALEFYHFTGKKISEHNEEQKSKGDAFNACYFVLNDERSLIYERIEKRVDEMLNAGLLDEVKALKDKGLTRDYVSMQGLGYKEILDYLDGEISLDEAIYIIKRDTRHFAKRQITWFKREPSVIWVNKPDFDYDDNKIIDFMVGRCKEAGINKKLF
ncbi:MAG: tRNA (adenosine(37)-N6)-dimethylallyltransferase MiaA [Lachnospiraceae bacterium]|nr:tRNA (adenosine(37)-N6)-dimethylallyltransferase MiaA [Lachnospiraceae bacterium]